jgi:hypothetical protein
LSAEAVIETTPGTLNSFLVLRVRLTVPALGLLSRQVCALYFKFLPFMFWPHVRFLCPGGQGLGWYHDPYQLRQQSLEQQLPKSSRHNFTALREEVGEEPAQSETRDHAGCREADGCTAPNRRIPLLMWLCCDVSIKPLPLVRWLLLTFDCCADESSCCSYCTRRCR